MNSINLHQTQAHNKLLEETTNLPDLTNDATLTSDRLEKFQAQAGSLKLLYGTQRLNESTLDLLQELATESDAIGQFQKQIAGEYMNKVDGYDCENRQVLHTSTRDMFNDGLGQASEPETLPIIKGEFEKLKAFHDELENGTLVNKDGDAFEAIVHIGIGGSDLGPRAIYLALKAYAKRSLHFVSNVDPDDAVDVLKGLNLKRCLAVIVSKSGTTLETLSNEALVRSFFEKAGLNWRDHAIAVTGKDSPMDDPNKYLRTFYIDDYIGGRYSSTSVVGGVSLTFALGFQNFSDFLQGARDIDLNSQEPDIRKNVALLMALIGIWNRNYLDFESLAIIPYSQALSRLAAHMQQCDMESNGKRINRVGETVPYKTGPVIWGEPGTNSQHAFFQLIHQSETIIPVEFIGFKKSQYGKDYSFNNTDSQDKLLANLFAQSFGLANGSQDLQNPNRHFPGNRPSSILFADCLTPKVMGEILALYENKIAFQGYIWNINSFDQEGVQLGKLLANGILKAKRGENDTTFTQEKLLQNLGIL